MFIIENYSNFTIQRTSYTPLWGQECITFKGMTHETKEGVFHGILGLLCHMQLEVTHQHHEPKVNLQSMGDTVYTPLEKIEKL